MASPRRIEFPGAIHHVTSRGVNRMPIFEDDLDRELFLELLADVAERAGWCCLAYCLLTNHYHLVVETPAPNLAAGMQRLNAWYARAFNRRHGRTGHLFEDRYHAVVVQRESHLLEVARYVVLNPVRAGACGAPEDWRWSSYRATAGLEAAPAFLRANELLLLLAPDEERAQPRYRSYVRAAAAARPWRNLRRGRVLGDADFGRLTLAGAGSGSGRARAAPRGRSSGPRRRAPPRGGR